MSAKHARQTLLIDVGDKQRQEAQALPQITPRELIEAILEEFTEFEYLGPPAADYVLVRPDDPTPLDEEESLERQVTQGEHLLLREREAPLPPGTRPPGQRAYLREKPSTQEPPIARVHKLHWLPAVIGRRGQDAATTEEVAVNLSAHPDGLRVSRRHAQIDEEDGQFYIESLSSNPTTVHMGDQQKTVETGRCPLKHGDVIYLVRSEIALQFIVRDEKENGDEREHRSGAV